MYEKVKEPIREGVCMIEQETEEEKAHERNMKSMREDEKHQRKRGKAYQGQTLNVSVGVCIWGSKRENESVHKREERCNRRSEKVSERGKAGENG